MLTDDQMKEMYAMTKDNNRMLHGMRRSAMIGGLFKVIFYVVFVIVPLWYAVQYLAPLMNQALSAAAGIHGFSAISYIYLTGLSGPQK